MTTLTPSFTSTARRTEHLLHRARIAFAKSGGREQPSDASDVTDLDGTTAVTLRNINGVLAVYRLHRGALVRVAATAVGAA